MEKEREVRIGIKIEDDGAVSSAREKEEIMGRLERHVYPKIKALIEACDNLGVTMVGAIYPNAEHSPGAIVPFHTMDKDNWGETFAVKDRTAPLEFVLAGGLLIGVMEPAAVGNGVFVMRPRSLEDYKRMVAE